MVNFSPTPRYTSCKFPALCCYWRLNFLGQDVEKTWDRAEFLETDSRRYFFWVGLWKNWMCRQKSGRLFFCWLGCRGMGGVELWVGVC